MGDEGEHPEGLPGRAIFLLLLPYPRSLEVSKADDGSLRILTVAGLMCE